MGFSKSRWVSPREQDRFDPTAKIGSLKGVVNSPTTNQHGIPWVLTRSQIPGSKPRKLRELATRPRGLRLGDDAVLPLAGLHVHKAIELVGGDGLARREAQLEASQQMRSVCGSRFAQGNPKTPPF